MFGEMKGGEWTTLEVEAAGLGYDVVTIVDKQLSQVYLEIRVQNGNCSFHSPVPHY